MFPKIAASPSGFPGILSTLKGHLIHGGTRPRRILGGAFKGIRMQLDLRFQMQLWLGTFEWEVSPWLHRFASSVKTGIDIGAGQGEYSLFLLCKTDARQVLAFEPDSESRSLFRSNLALNEFGHSERVVLSDKAVGCGDGFTVSLDSLMNSIVEPCFVKIDVEGFETDVLKGARRVLSMPRVRLIVETHSVGCENDCVALLRCAGFHTKIVGVAWWRVALPEYRPSLHNRWLVAWKEPGFGVSSSTHE